jgi:hypothetical protein
MKSIEIIKRGLAVCALLSATALIGCGGGGAGTSLTSTSGTGRAAVLLADSPNDDYSHVWATIYHAELVPATGTNGGANVVLYDNTAGIQVDLRTLHDTTGARFAFLSTATIPAGTYTAIKVTIGPTIQLIPVGATTGTSVTVSSTLPKDANGNPIVTDTFKTPKTFTATTNTLVLDFNLAHFIVTASNVLPVIEDGSTSTCDDPSRHNPNEQIGTVSNLTGTSPTLTFTLTEGSGDTVTVVTTASTAVSGTTTLANGTVADVVGTIDPTTLNFVATTLTVLPAGTALPGPSTTQRAMGTASILNATAGTFTLTLADTHGFTPTTTTVNVVTTSTTLYYDDSGAATTEAALFTTLATTPTVALKGTYDSTTNTFTATSISITNHANDGGWEHSQHKFRPGDDAGNWGHGVVGGH